MKTENDNQTADSPRLDDSPCSPDWEYFERYGVRLEGLNDNGEKYWNAVCRYPYGNGEGDTIAAAIEDAKSNSEENSQDREQP